MNYSLTKHIRKLFPLHTHSDSIKWLRKFLCIRIGDIKLILLIFEAFTFTILSEPLPLVVKLYSPWPKLSAESLRVPLYIKNLLTSVSFCRKFFFFLLRVNSWTLSIGFVSGITQPFILYIKFFTGYIKGTAFVIALETFYLEVTWKKINLKFFAIRTAPLFDAFCWLLWDKKALF